MTFPNEMAAVLLIGHGGIDMLEYRTDVPVPKPQAGEVLINVAAAGINNTDINTRTAWYSKSVLTATNDGGAKGFDQADDADASWSGKPMSFPRIQGADACGYIVAVGDGVDPVRLGERVLVRNMLRTYVDDRPYECWTFGSECDGSFAQFTVAPSRETHAVECDWSDAELASIPCAYSTAENMLHRANVKAERVLVTGASGGVGSAAVQLAKRRGAHVTAVCSQMKADDVMALGADRVIDRHADLLIEMKRDSIDVVVDLVAGKSWPAFMELLRPGGRYGRYEDLLADPGIDVVYISLPPSYHALWTIRALEAGKHVICEKPIAMNLAEAKAMVAAAQTNGKRVIEAFHTRYHPAFVQCMDWVEAGAIGKITSLNAHFGVGISDDGMKNQYRPEMGGGATMDLGCYPLHWVGSLAGAQVSDAQVEKTLAPSGVDQTLNAELTFSNGITANVSTSMRPSAPNAASLKISGTLGKITFENPVAPHIDGTLSKTVAGITQWANVSTVSTFSYQLQAISYALKSNQTLPSEGDGLLSQQAEIDRLYTAAGLGNLRKSIQLFG